MDIFNNDYDKIKNAYDPMEEFYRRKSAYDEALAKAQAEAEAEMAAEQAAQTSNLPQETSLSLFGKSALRGLLDPFAGTGTYLKEKGFNNGLTNWMAESSYDDLSKGTGFQIGNYAKLDKDASFYDRWLNIGNEATRMRLAENFGSAIGSMANFVGLGKVAGTVAKQTGKALVKAVGKTAAEEGTEEVAKAIAKDGAFETAGKWIKKNAYDLAGGAGAGLYESVGNIGSAVENMRNPNNLNPLTKQPYTEDEIKAAISRGESQIPLDMLLGATEFGAFANKGLKAIDKIQNPLTRTAADVTSRFAVGAIPESYQELLQTRTEQDMYKPSGDSFFSKLSFMPRNAEELDAMIMGGLMGGTITGGIGLYDRYKENKFANEVNAELESNFNTAYSNPYTHANLTDIVSMVEENAPNNPMLQSLVDENANLTFGEKAINYVNALPNIENIDSVIGELPKVDKRQYATDKYGQINELDMLQKITDEYIDEQGKGLKYKQAKDKLSELRNISKEDAIELTNKGLFVPDETLIRHGIKTPNQITAERANELYTIINNQLDMPKINGRNADTIGKNILNIIKSNANTAAETVLSAYNLTKQKGAISEANFVKAIENAKNQEYLVDAIEELPKLKELVNEIQNPKLKEELANVLNSSASPVSRSILSNSMADKNVLNNISSMYDKVYKFGVRSSVLPRNAEQARSLYRALRDGGSIKGVEYGLTKTPNGRVISHWNVFDDSMQTGEHEFAHVMDSLLGNVSLRHSQMKDFTLKNIDNLISAYQVDGRMIDGTKTGVISKDEAIQIKNELTNTQDLQQTSLMTRSFVREVLADAKMGGVYIDENGNYVSPDGKTDIVASKIKEMVESHDGMKRFLNWFSEGITEDFKAEIQKTVNEMQFNDSGISFLADAKRQELAEKFEIPQNSIIEYGVREILGGYRRQLRKDFISEFKNQGFEFKFVDGTPTIIKGNKELTVFQVLKGISDAKKMFGKDLGKAQEIIQNSLTNQYEKIAYQKLAMKVYWKLVPKSIANILGVETSYSDSLNTSIGRLFMSNSKYKDGGILRGHYTFGGKERYIESSYEFALFAKLEKLQKEGKIQSFFKLEEIPELLGIENRALVEYTKENRERGIYNTDIFAIDNQGRMIVYEVKPLSKIAGEKDISIKANAWIDIIKEYLKDKNEFKNKTDIIHGIAMKKNLDSTKTGKPGEYETYVIRNSFAKTMEKLENKMGWNGKESEYRFYTEKDIQKDLKDGYIRDKAKEFNTKFNMTISEQLNSGKYLKDIFDDVNNRIKKIKSNENWEKEKSKIRAIKRYEEYLNSLDLLYQKDSRLSTADYEQLSDIFKNIERTNYMDNKANVIVDKIEKDNKYAMNFRGYKLYQGTENIIDALQQKEWKSNGQGLQQFKNALKKQGIRDTAIDNMQLNELWDYLSTPIPSDDDWGIIEQPNGKINKQQIKDWLNNFRPVIVKHNTKNTKFKDYVVSTEDYAEDTYHLGGNDYTVPILHYFNDYKQNASDRFAHARTSKVDGVTSDGRKHRIHFIEEVQSDDAIAIKNTKTKYPKEIAKTEKEIKTIMNFISNIDGTNIELTPIDEDGHGTIVINDAEIGDYVYHEFGDNSSLVANITDKIIIDNFTNIEQLKRWLGNRDNKLRIGNNLLSEIGNLSSELNQIKREIENEQKSPQKLLTRNKGEDINDWVNPVLKDQIIQALENEDVSAIAISTPAIQAERWGSKQPQTYSYYNSYLKQIGQILSKYIPGIKPKSFKLTDSGLNVYGYTFENVGNTSNVAEQIRSDGIAYRAKKPGGMNPIAERNNLMDVRDVVFTQNSQQFQRNQDAMQVLRNAGWTERNQNGTITFSRPNPEPSHNRVKVVSGLINNEQKERIVDWKTPKGIKEQVFRMWDNIQTNWVEELQPLKALGRYIPEMYDIYDSAWVASRGWTGKVRALIEFGKQGVDLRDGRGRVNIKSLKEIMKNIDENQLDDFETFTIAKRTIDLANRPTPIQQALTLQEAQIIVANAPQNFVQAQKDLVDLQRYLLRQLVESGIIKESSYAHFINVDPNYIPLFKDFGEEDLAGAVNQINGRSFVNIGSPIKKLKGDTQHETLSPIQSILKHMYQFHSMAERNKVGQKFVGLRNLPHMQDILVQVSAPADRTENVFSVWENGERKYYETTRDLYNALTSINTRQADVVLTMLQKPAHWLRVGATMSPDFAFRNFVRDQFTAWLFTKNGYIPFVDAIRGISHIAKKDDIYQRYLTSGAAHADIVSLDRNYLKKNVRKMVKSQPVWSKVTKNPLTIIKAVYETFGKGFEYLGDLSQNLEVATRVAEFENALKKGKTEERAALESRDVTLDFSRAGTMGKKVNRYIAFFNATIQGGDKFRREIVTRPGTMAFRFGMIALVSAALWYANHDDDRVKELPRWQKDLFWIIPGKDYLVRIPKPFEAGLMFGTGTERFLSYFKDNDPKAFKDFGKALLEGFTPNMMFTALQPIMEVMANYSLFKERNIVPTAEQNYAPYMQFGPYTSETAKMAGKILNVSPRKIDHLIQGYFGSLGSNINRSIDQGTNAVTSKNMPEKKPNEWIAGLTAFTSTPYASPQSIQDLYERNKELEQLRNEVKAKNKPVKDYPIQEHERIKDAVDALGKLNKLGKEVIKSETLTSAQKREKLDKIKMKELEIAKKALNKK